MYKLLCALIPLIYIDLAFIVISFQSLSFELLIKVLFFNLFISFLLSAISSKKKYISISIIVLFIFSLYAFIQLEFKNFVGSFYSFQAVSEGIGGTKGYIWYFISNAKLSFYLEFISIVIFVLLTKKINEDYIQKRPYKKLLLSIVSLIITILLPLCSIKDELRDSYKYHDNYDLLLNNIGINHFFMKDIYSSLFPREYVLTIKEEEENIVEETITPKKEIDDTKWNELMKKEKDESILNVDKYLSSKNKVHENEYTGQYEGYNFIYFLTESLDFMAIDKDLTPTLYKIWNNSYHFTNHFSPIYACATGDSEFVAMTSIYPYRSVCTPYEVLNNNLTSSLAGLFKNEGYTVKAFHNWTDQFYKRSQLEYAYGVDEYKDYDSLNIKDVVGWQSDNELINKTISDYIYEDKFFTFYITSSMHWPYDEYSYLGEKYFDKINQYHKDYPEDVKRYLSKSMEFNLALETLLQELKYANKLDNTVICIFSDHRPFKFETDIFRTYSLLEDRKRTYGSYLTPFIIYNSKTEGKEITNTCSTIDHLPTIANLFNLNYDPRLYMGDDALTDECVVVMNNLDWITNKGAYAKSDKSTYADLDKDYIDNINAHVNNLVNVSKTILNNDYIEKRKDIIFPIYK